MVSLGSPMGSSQDRSWSLLSASSTPNTPSRRPQPRPGPTLCKENVRTQNVASSMVSSSVTWMKPYVSVPLLGQY